MKLTYFLLVCLSCIVISCKPANTEVTVNEKPEAPSSPVYPALGSQEITQLYAMTDKVDMIFYDLPISVNQDDAKSAKNSALYVSPAPAVMNKSCKPLGRLTWMSDGAIIKEADIYMDSTCHYFLFMTNNQPVAANAMSESGVQFFTSIISQVQQRQPK